LSGWVRSSVVRNRGSWAPLAEARVRDVDEPRVELAELPVPEPPLRLGRAGLEVLDHHVRAGGELPDQGLAVGVMHVDADVVLAVILGEERH
jgi:hypothetical protein